MGADPITQNTVSHLLNYDISDDDDPFKDIDEALRVREDKATLSPRAVKRKAENNKENDVLGLDEEVTITKKRKPIAKLDETRLLSQPGIPKLRSLARSGQMAKKLHLKGKGHEFSDAAKLLNYYQLWLDNLYPRAKFADGLQLVEKAGHSKRMQTMRKTWIDEGKPGYATERYTAKQKTDGVQNDPSGDITKGPDIGSADSNIERASRSVADHTTLENVGDPEDPFVLDTRKKPGKDDDDAAPEDDELDALLAEQSSSHMSRPKPAEPDSEGEDDFDALLAEHELYSHDRNPTVNTDSFPDGEDDVDALQAEHEASFRSVEGVDPRDAPERDHDLDAMPAKCESNEPNGADAVAAAASSSSSSSSPLPSICDDEDSALVT